jgi:ribonuclease D
LSAKQIQYALDDVRYLIPLWTEVSRVLHERGRTDWYTDERDGQFRSLLLDPAQRTRRITGGGGLNPRSAAVLREIVAWREERARQLNRPPRWIVRDDIVSELAKRQPSTIEELKSTRGLAIDNKSTWARDLLAAIHRGLDLPDDQLPQPAHRRETTDEQMVVKILAAAMIQRGSELGIATGLIGSNEDLREMLDWYRRGSSDTDRPSLVQQWREDVVGKYLRQILAGHVVARIITDDDGIELRFEPVPPIC